MPKTEVFFPDMLVFPSFHRFKEQRSGQTGGAIIVGLLLCLDLQQAGWAQAPRNDPERPEVQLVSFVLDDVQKNWDRMLPLQEHIPYRHAKLVLYRNAYPSACGMAKTAVGPFYCPGDEKVYLDRVSSMNCKTRYGAPGEFAQAYVIAHEIGHHVQKLLGIETRVRRLQAAQSG